MKPVTGLTRLHFYRMLVALLIFVPAGWAKAGLDQVAAAIRYEATLSNDGAAGRPLPLAAHWNTGVFSDGFQPEYQLAMIERGHYLLPAFFLPEPWKIESYFPGRYAYYEKAIRKAAELNLPISFIGTQWERYLTVAPQYFYRVGNENPNVIEKTGAILKKVSPFGPMDLWREVGQKWTSTELLKKLQEWYPDPPLVLFISNNEHDKLSWDEVEESSRYLSEFGLNQNDDFKRAIVAKRWIARYRALQGGMRDALIDADWNKRSEFIAYNAFGPRSFGRWKDWRRYSLYIPGRIDPWPLAWDGASLSYYVNHWNSRTDFTVMSPQIEAMNQVFMVDEARRLNPGFRLELSTWDGYVPTQANDKRKYYATLGQTYSPERYKGYVQFGMWLLRPGLVREFRGNESVFSEDEPYFLSVVNAVDRVHNTPLLTQFWRNGRLVANAQHPHPYQTDIPQEYKEVSRWFLLDTDLDPKRPWNLDTYIPVFSLALVTGERPNREWLVYAHSPLREFHDVRVDIPDYAPVVLNTSPGGDFYHVIEKTGQVRLVD